MAAHGWQVTFCEVHVMVHVASDDAEHHEEHLLQHWWWIMEQVWRSNLKIGLIQSNGERYSGDVLFLEDDLEVADDFVAVVKHLVRLKSKPIPETPWMAEVAALGGWGGEMMINAHKRWKPSLAVCVCVCVCLFLFLLKALHPVFKCVRLSCVWQDFHRPDLRQLAHDGLHVQPELL